MASQKTANKKIATLVYFTWCQNNFILSLKNFWYVMHYSFFWEKIIYFVLLYLQYQTVFICITLINYLCYNKIRVGTYPFPFCTYVFRSLLLYIETIIPYDQSYLEKKSQGSFLIFPIQVGMSTEMSPDSHFWKGDLTPRSTN